MSNKEFEDKVLSALDQLTTKIDWVESALTVKMNAQTFELKREMRQNTAYIEQAFKYISEVDKQNYMDKHNLSYA